MSAVKRQSNFELLRIIAMFMVVCLHYLSHANALSTAGQAETFTQVLGDLPESLCIVSVNVYVLITGYFLSKSSFRLSKLLSLLSEILFYTLLIPLILTLAGIAPAAANIWERWFWFLPVTMEAYWFITAYVILYILSPFLNAGLDALPQQQMKQLLAVLLFVFCFLPSVSPVKLTIDKAGYDCLWFIVLYLLAGYFRKYGIPGLAGRDGTISRSKALSLYFVSAFLVFAMTVILNKVSAGGSFLYYAEVPFHYNFIFVLTASVGLFGSFITITIPEGRGADLIRRAAPLTLGVYLIHENPDIRDRWLPAMEKLFGPVPEGVGLIPHMILCAAVLFVVCILIDVIRRFIFDHIMIRLRGFYELCSKK